MEAGPTIASKIGLKRMMETAPRVVLGVAQKVTLTVAPKVARRLSLVPAPMLPARKTSPVS